MTLVARLRDEARQGWDVGRVRALLNEAAVQIETDKMLRAGGVADLTRALDRIAVLERELADCRGDQHACKYLEELERCQQNARSEVRADGSE